MSRVNALLTGGMKKHLAFAVVGGTITEEDAWTAQRRAARGKQLASIKPSAWPNFDIAWDTNPFQFHLALDGMTADKFAVLFTQIEVVGVESQELCANLVQASTRLAGPFSRRYKWKSAGIVAHLEDGGRLTPPLIRYNDEDVLIAGGNHRFGLARHKQMEKICVLILKAERAPLNALLRT